MKDGGKVNIDLIEEDFSYKERCSQWSSSMHAFLRDSVVRKVGSVRIIVKKAESRYVLVAGHHLLKAARECGLREVYVDVVDSATPPAEYLRHFTEIVTDCFGRSRKAETFSQTSAHA